MSSPFCRSIGNSLATFTAVSANTVPSEPGMMAAVLTGLMVPVLVTSGPPKRTSALMSADQYFQPTSFPRSNFVRIWNVPLYSLSSHDAG